MTYADILMIYVLISKDGDTIFGRYIMTMPWYFANTILSPRRFLLTMFATQGGRRSAGLSAGDAYFAEQDTLRHDADTAYAPEVMPW